MLDDTSAIQAIAGDASGIQAIADLGEAAEKSREIPVETGDPALDSTLIVRVERNDEEVRIHDLERFLIAPRTIRGKATVHDASSFAALVTRLADAGTTIWADDHARSMTAVFDDHANSVTPGWRAHTAALTVRVDPDWQAWTGRDGKLSPQMSFGEFLEDHLESIIDPPAAVMMEVATTLVAKRDLAFESSARLQSGDVGFTYRETTTAGAGKKGNIEIPEMFKIRVCPFIGCDPVEVVARLRYRISGDGLQIGYRLLRPDLHEQAAFEFLVQLVRAGTPPEVPILLGTPPASLR